ncbi:UNVERIFIED_CONTAM: Ctsk [Trichonephila clavipes]
MPEESTLITRCNSEPHSRLIMKLLATFVCLIVAVASISVPSNPEMDVFWESFKKAHNKSYTQEEERYRRLIWEENVIDIIRHNLQANQGLYSYKRGINKYTDLTEKEIMEKLTGLKVPLKSNITGSEWLPPTNVVIPDEIDWRKKGYVTEVKDQVRVCLDLMIQQNKYTNQNLLSAI